MTDITDDSAQQALEALGKRNQELIDRLQVHPLAFLQARLEFLVDWTVGQAGRAAFEYGFNQKLNDQLESAARTQGNNLVVPEHVARERNGLQVIKGGA